MRYFVALILLASLSACGDPLANIEKIGDVELAPEEPIAQALPDASETQSEGGFLSRLIAPKTVEPVAAPVSEIAQDAVVSDATTGVTLDAPVDPITAALSEAQALETPEPSPTGVRGWLRRSADRAKAQDTAQAVVPVAPEIPAPVEALAPVEVAAEIPQVSEPAPEAAPAIVVEAEKRRGLLGIFKPETVDEAQVQTASLSPEPAAPQTDALAQPVPELSVEPKKRRGLFGGTTASAPRKGPDARDVEYGEVLPYGEVARVCSARGRPLGRKIDKAPARGRGYALYDSAPNSEAPRTFYVTGFGDGCPRQFTAALALLGAPTLHEQLRYGLPSDEYPYSTTDKAYEKVKSSVCRVSKRKPCGAKIGELEKNTVFISTYERFGNNARWADILIHDGAVLAAAIKKP